MQTAMRYDADGNLTSIAFPNGVIESTTFNTTEHLTKISSINSGKTSLASFTYSYTNPSTKLPTLPRYSVVRG